TADTVDVHTLSLHDALPILGSLTGLKGHREVAEAFARLDTGGRPAVLVLNGNKLSGLGSPSAAREGAPGMLLRRALVALRQEGRSEEHTSELQSHLNLVCRL